LSGIVFAQRVIDLDKVWGDMRVLGDDAEDESGYAVAHGDINGDGFMDIIIGAWRADPGDPPRTNAGETYVIFGSGSPLSTIDLDSQSANITVYGSNEWNNCGKAVASGDVNGDGYDDIIIGVPGADAPGGIGAGKTHVIFGSDSPSSTIDLSTQSTDITICGDNPGDLSGSALASGDVNGDGYADIIIGVSSADPGNTYVILGNSFASPPYTIDLNSQSADITVCGADAGDRFGCAVASGDINGDSYYDIIIGAPLTNTPGGTRAGKAYVIFGSSFPLPPYTIDLSTTPANITICGASTDDYCAREVASGDVNGDGYEDVIIGAWSADTPVGQNAGKVYVIFGAIIPGTVTIDFSTQLADITVCGDDAEDQVGAAVTSGDINGDGYYDLIISAPAADPPGGDHAGEIYAIFGKSFSSPPYTIDLDSQSADITICGDDTWYMYKGAVTSGDVNGDSYDDVIIGADRASPGGRTKAGETDLILGGGAIITAHGLGGKSWIKQFSLLGRDWGSFKAFGAVNSQGEVHLSIGDMDADNLDEIAAGQGEGAKSWVKFFEVNGSLISTFKAFGAANTNGELHIALGNFDADAPEEIVVAQGEGGQSWVKLFETDGTLIASFKAFGAANAQGEVHVAAIDLNADGIDEIAVATGEGGVSSVKIFDSIWLNLIHSFKAFDSTDNPGGEVRLAVGNFDADADLEIAASTGYNGGNKVRLFDKDGTLIKQFLAFGFGGNTNGDVQITAADIDNDGVDEIICAHGEGASSQVKVFKANGTVILSFKAFGGVNAQGEVHLGRSNY
ncbi:MAG: hypothetical protein OEZ30_08560, partial [Candidatus Aminicenantes bacterium]|nr:hypothetical protein [Candidatus Aminicenantes bacterium]